MLYLKKYSFEFFKYGLFFLSSAPIVSVFLILLAAILNLNKETKLNLTNIWSKSFLFIGILIFISALFNHYFNYGSIFNNQEKLNSLLGLANWIPFFLLFPFFQTLLSTHQKRETAIKFLVAGSLTVVFTGIAQYFFNIYGPFSIMNNFVIWYMKDISDPDNLNVGLAGLFSNQNYTATWLNIVLPLSVGLLQNKKNNKLKKIIIFLFILLFVSCLVLTRSRTSFLTFYLTFQAFASIKYSLLLIIPIFIILILPILSFVSFLPDQLTIFFKAISPNFALTKYSEYLNAYGTFLPRLEIWSKALKIISERPLLGWGASTFPILYVINEGIIKTQKISLQHSHNIFFELSINYGLVVSVVLSLIVFLIIRKSFKQIYDKKNEFQYISKINKSWWIATVILITNLLVDMPYYDVRISLSLWILLAGLTQIIKNQEEKTFFKN